MSIRETIKKFIRGKVPDPQVITTQDELNALVKDLSKSPYIAVDTEFHRERTYYAKLCLIQVGTDDVIAAVDPFADLDLKPLLNLLLDKKILKVFHAAKQDLEIFHNMTGQVLAPIFDTQIAAMALGLGEQIGYMPLVKKILNIDLSKAQQMTDWTRRPLTDQQLAYALDDVIYLRDLYKDMEKQLRKKNRFTWLEEEERRLVDPRNFAPTSDDLWQGIKCRDKNPRTVTALKALAIWRDEMARQLNKPRTFILRDEPLAAIAQYRPNSVDKLEQLRNVPGDIIRNYGPSIVALMSKINQMPDKNLVRAEIKHRNARGIDSVSAAMASLYLRLKAEEADISPRLLASADELDDFLRGDRKVPIASGWRYELAGKGLEELINGRIALSVKRGKLTEISVK